MPPARALLIFALSLCFLHGCAAPTPAPIPRAEIARREIVIGDTLGRQLEQKLDFARDKEIEVYLRGLATRLAQTDPKLRDATLGVQILRNQQGIWRSFALPGNRVYLSAGFLKRCELETEIAGLLAMELSHLARGDALDRLREQVTKDSPDRMPDSLLPPQPGDLPAHLDFFGPDGIFAFNERAQVEGARGAVRLLYAAGYDPRGLLGVWQKLIRSPEHSPYDLETLDKLVEATRKTVSALPPLRNPVVRSGSFVGLKQRIQSL
jgi:hypothetical protein